jgi:uncharacterized protein involved in outer membrane biogenesis
MKRYVLCFLVSSFLATGSVGFGAESKATHAPAPAKTTLAGEFSGQWNGENGASGALKLKFTLGKDSVWTSEATFTFEGVEVPTIAKSLRVDGDKIEVVFAWEVQGTAASSTLKGKRNGDELEGTYDSTTAERAAAGTWKVTRVPPRPKVGS